MTTTESARSPPPLPHKNNPDYAPGCYSILFNIVYKIT